MNNNLKPTIHLQTPFGGMVRSTVIKNAIETAIMWDCVIVVRFNNGNIRATPVSTPEQIEREYSWEVKGEK